MDKKFWGQISLLALLTTRQKRIQLRLLNLALPPLHLIFDIVLGGEGE